MKVPEAGGVTSCVPERATAPLQASVAWSGAVVAWHPVALELDQVSVVVWPTVSAVGLAPILTMTGLGVVVGAEDAPPPPPPPLQETSRKHAATAANCNKPHTRG